MPGLTSRLALRKPFGGSSGSTPPEQVDIDVINGNMDKLDSTVGAPGYLSTALPATPFNGQMVRETDTGDILVFTGTNWEAVISGAPRELMTASQNQADVSNNGVVQDASAPAAFTMGRAQNALVLFSAEASTAGSNAAGNLYLQHNGVNLLPIKRIQALSSATGRRDITLVCRVRLVAGSNTIKFLASSDSGGTQISYTDISFKVVTV